MSRVKMTPMVKFAMIFLRFYLIIMLVLIGLKFFKSIL